MVSSKATTVQDYLAELDDERRTLVQAIRDVVNDNLPAGYQETMQYGMIGWSVPHDLYPSGYHCDPTQPLPFAALASQKQYVSLYLMSVYLGGDESEAGQQSGETDELRWFRDAWLKTGKKLDMGKSCVRIKRIEDVATEVVAEAISRVPVETYIARYEDAIPASKRGTKVRQK